MPSNRRPNATWAGDSCLAETEEVAGKTKCVCLCCSDKKIFAFAKKNKGRHALNFTTMEKANIRKPDKGVKWDKGRIKPHLDHKAHE